MKFPRSLPLPTSVNSISGYVCCLALLGTCSLHVLSLVYRTAVNYDAAQYLTAGKMAWNGELPFVGFVDVNPPMIVYLSAIPAALADIFSLSLPITALLFFFSLVLLTAVVFSESLALNLRLNWPQRFIIWTFWIWISLFTYQHGAFGQREQLIFLFLAPFLCLRRARYAGVSINSWFAALLAILAFLALAMKPQFALPLVMAEGLFLFSAYRRSYKPLISLEIVIVALLCVAYLLHFLVVPGMSAFYTIWLPMILKGYSAYSEDKAVLLRNLINTPYIACYFCAALLASSAPFVGRRAFWQLVGAVGVFSLGSLLVHIQQSKGWIYHLLPFLSFSLLATLLAFIYFVHKQVPRSHRNLILSLGGLALFSTCTPNIATIVVDVVDQQPFKFPRSQLSELITSLTDPTDSIVSIGPSVTPTFPALIYANRPYGSRFLTTFPLVFIFHDSADYIVPEKWQQEEPLIYEMIVEDVTRSQPRLVLVRSGPKGQGLPEDFIFTKYLERKEFFTTALKNYVRVGTHRGFDIYYLPRSEANSDAAFQSAIPYAQLQMLQDKGILQLDDKLQPR